MFTELEKHALENDHSKPNKKLIFENLSRVFRTKKYNKGDLLFHMGQDADHMLLQLKGQIEIAVPKSDAEKNEESHLFESIKNTIEEKNIFQISKRFIMLSIKDR